MAAAVKLVAAAAGRRRWPHCVTCSDRSGGNVDEAAAGAAQAAVGPAVEQGRPASCFVILRYP